MSLDPKQQGMCGATSADCSYVYDATGSIVKNCNTIQRNRDIFFTKDCADVLWYNSSAIKVLERVVQIIGPPDIIKQELGGYAIWKKDSLCKKKIYGKKCIFHEILIRDEAIDGIYSRYNKECIYLTIKMDISHSDIIKFRSIFKPLKYDDSKKLLQIRSINLETGISILTLFIEIIQGSISEVEADDGKMVSKLNIMGTNPGMTEHQYYTLLYFLQYQPGFLVSQLNMKNCTYPNKADYDMKKTNYTEYQQPIQNGYNFFNNPFWVSDLCKKK